MKLDNLIGDAFRQGCTGITIWRSEAHGYQANVRNSDGKSWRVEVDRNPTRALRKALGDIPGASGQMRPRRRDEELI